MKRFLLFLALVATPVSADPNAKLYSMVLAARTCSKPAGTKGVSDCVFAPLSLRIVITNVGPNALVSFTHSDMDEPVFGGMLAASGCIFIRSKATDESVFISSRTAKVYSEPTACVERR